MAEPIPPSEAKAASLGATDETSRAANNLATVRRALADLEFTFVELENGLKIPNVRGSLYIYDIFIASFPAMITFSIAMPFNIPTDRELIVAAIMGRINAKINIGNFESLSSRVYYRIGIPVNNLIQDSFLSLVLDFCSYTIDRFGKNIARACDGSLALEQATDELI